MFTPDSPAAPCELRDSHDGPIYVTTKHPGLTALDYAAIHIAASLAAKYGPTESNSTVAYDMAEALQRESVHRQAEREQRGRTADEYPSPF